MRYGVLQVVSGALALAAIIVSAPVRAQSTSDASPNGIRTYADGGHSVILGDVIPVGGGTGRSWVEIDESGRPVRLGLTLTESSLDGLKHDATPGLIWTDEYLLRMPSGVQGLPFNHIGLNWNPKGHPPVELYGPGHFDVHFYLISPEDRRQITARGDDLDIIRKAPPQGYMAPEYVWAPDSEEPGMGGHWVDPNSHEFHGQGFTSTFIYGTYNGDIIFYEPMITRDFLASRPDRTASVPVPRKYRTAGFYPTGYSVRYDESRKEIVVALEGLTERKAS